MHSAPLIEPDRFFAAPRDGRAVDDDAQTSALTRLIMRCERLRPHLRSVEALEAFIARQAEPTRVLRRIGLALALEQPGVETYGQAPGRAELAAFRALALQRTAAIVWVFG
jgi:hypothetical protein